MISASSMPCRHSLNAEVAVAEPTLEDEQRHAFARELDGRAWRSWCGAKRRRTPAAAAVLRRSARAARGEQVAAARRTGEDAEQRPDAVELARAYPRAPLILAHAAIADLAWIWHEGAGLRNLFFDTAWWNTADQLALFSLIAPGQILFASDTPYGRTLAAATVVLRAALAAGLDEEQLASVAGGQLERLLARAEPRDLGPAPAASAPAPGPLLERVHTLLVAAAGRLTAGYLADEYLELARLACELPADHPDAPAAASVHELLDRHAAYTATDPPRRGPRAPGVHMIFVAAAIARTRVLPLPVGAR
jgi:hypothetical protein